MQAILGLLLLFGLIYTTIGASGIFQSINIGADGGGLTRSSNGNDDWSESVHNADVDRALKLLEKLDNSGNDRNNWGNDAVRNSGFDVNRSKGDSDEDARGFQFINFG
ncbi:LOW QUALITY PROTEIN: uncharacterized protein LOC108108021 [Drosophila eugracilis]|uniref:LOW QUALITY PROTEIN: uncharacterized protein LOC108108021 n=1 Tax=Drosophila eugracilis TaxID=29029 RepID=UPI001BDB3571|nr:LOW QUALITY PROTEIN: uncharacterized protein LOC108108021 [Drosophila eugracilis]